LAEWYGKKFLNALLMQKMMRKFTERTLDAKSDAKITDHTFDTEK
jgi:hypothetical protein